jgi:2-hydroxy-4-carboxymuconate semialdehyde hemiacetal dehydrogenase
VHADADARRADDRLPEVGKHVQVEIPLADTLKGAEEVLALQKQTGKVAMVGHTRRFNPSHQWVHKRIVAREFNIQQMDVQTYFFRRTNMNALGQARSWTDHLLWHHAAHTVDLFRYQSGGEIVQANAVQGPIHPNLGIAMDMSIQLKASTGAICTLSLSFNNDGHWVRSSVTSATAAPTSRATTICSTARKKRSTSARSTSR